MDAPEVLSKLDVRRKIVLAVVIAAAAALLMWAGAVTWALIDYYDGQNGKMIVYEPVVEERRHISEGTLGTDENGEVQIPE